MLKIKLPQGTYAGFERGDVRHYNDIPYSAPFVRFGPPTKVSPYSGQPPLNYAVRYGYNCPQPTRLEFVVGAPPSSAGLQDEAKCGVLSIDRPIIGYPKRLAVIVFIHGGAFVSGGSQIPWYDGSRLASDGEVIVVSISYRLGAFGFLYADNQELPRGLEDVIAAFEWVRDHIEAFGGDPTNITAMGHSSGGYIVQTLLKIRPDLFKRAIIQSSPAGALLTFSDARSVRKVLEENLPKNKTVKSATAEDLLLAQTKAMKAHPNLSMPFMPWGTAGSYEGSPKKDILIGWMKHEGSCFAAFGLLTSGVAPWLANSMGFDLAGSLTRSIYSDPSKRLADALREQGHSVTTYEINWAPKGFELGATHAVDLPLLLGDEEAWEDAPMLGSVPWDEWEEKGRPFREAWGRFATTGTPPHSFIEGLTIHNAP